jgi:hypothetical protein
MTGSALAKKMKLKPGQRAAVLNAPPGYLDELKPLPDGVELVENLDGEFDWVQIFVQDQAKLATIAPNLAPALKPESLLWLSFPKGSSKIQTDLTRDRGWESLQGSDLKWTNLISVNETWSAFSLRPYKPGEERQSFR